MPQLVQTSSSRGADSGQSSSGTSSRPFDAAPTLERQRAGGLQTRPFEPSPAGGAAPGTTGRASGFLLGDRSPGREGEAMDTRALLHGTARLPSLLHRPEPRWNVVQFLRRPTGEERQTLEGMLEMMNLRLEEVRRANNKRPKTPVEEERIEVDLAGINQLGDEAIAYAIRIFEIDDSRARSIRSRIGKAGPFITLVSESSRGGSIAFGTTDRDRNVALGPSAFRSAATLGSTIGHEAFHAARHSGPSYTEDKAGVARQEVEAHGWELEHAHVFGLTDEEIVETQGMVEQYQREAEEADPPGGKKCFLTTACIEARGLPDDCAELETLRAFRDGWLAHRPGGPALIAEYYAIAPGLVDALHARADAPALLAGLYGEVTACVDLIRRREEEAALARYGALVLDLQTRLGT